MSEDGMLAVFEFFNDQLRAQGLIASCGKIIDASLLFSLSLVDVSSLRSSVVEAPKQRNRRHENEQIKRGEVPERIARRPRRACQKDLEARWTKKNNQSYYGYKNHVKVDAASKFIETFYSDPCRCA